MAAIDLGVIPFAHNIDPKLFKKVHGAPQSTEIHLKTDAEADEAVAPYSLAQQSLEEWIARILRAIRAETSAAVDLVICNTMQGAGNARNLAFAIEAAQNGGLSSMVDATGFRVRSASN